MVSTHLFGVIQVMLSIKARRSRVSWKSKASDINWLAGVPKSEDKMSRLKQGAKLLKNDRSYPMVVFLQSSNLLGNILVM